MPRFIDEWANESKWLALHAPGFVVDTGFARGIAKEEVLRTGLAPVSHVEIADGKERLVELLGHTGIQAQDAKVQTVFFGRARRSLASALGSSLDANKLAVAAKVHLGLEEFLDDVRSGEQKSRAICFEQNAAANVTRWSAPSQYMEGTH